MQSALDRRQGILDILVERRQESVANLVHEFGVSRRTILRDIEILSGSYPIYTMQGKGGGICVEEGYYPHRRYLKSTQENLLRELLTGLQPEKRVVMQSILDTFAKPQTKPHS